jgi:hypothetical protein
MTLLGHHPFVPLLRGHTSGRVERAEATALSL